MIKQRGLYQCKVTSSLATIQRPGHLAGNCKMDYYEKLDLHIIYLFTSSLSISIYNSKHTLNIHAQQSWITGVLGLVMAKTHTQYYVWNNNSNNKNNFRK